MSSRLILIIFSFFFFDLFVPLYLGRFRGSSNVAERKSVLFGGRSIVRIQMRRTGISGRVHQSVDFCRLDRRDHEQNLNASA